MYCSYCGSYVLLCDHEDHNARQLENIEKELDKFPGHARHFLLAYKDEEGNIGVAFQSLDLQVLAMKERIRKLRDGN